MREWSSNVSALGAEAAQVVAARLLFATRCAAVAVGFPNPLGTVQYRSSGSVRSSAAQATVSDSGQRPGADGSSRFQSVYVPVTRTEEDQSCGNCRSGHDPPLSLETPQLVP